jgi:hypothetical protein
MEPGASGVQVLPLEAACESALQPAAWVLSALRVGEAAEAAEPLALQPTGAAHVEAVGAVGPHAAVAREEARRVEVAAEALHGEAGVAEEPPASVAAERQAVREPRAARPSAAVPSSRLRSAPARRSAVRMRFAHAPRRLRTATPTARWWQAARDEVWSW